MMDQDHLMHNTVQVEVATKNKVVKVVQRQVVKLLQVVSCMVVLQTAPML